MIANDHAVLASSCIWNSRSALSWMQKAMPCWRGPAYKIHVPHFQDRRTMLCWRDPAYRIHAQHYHDGKRLCCVGKLPHLKFTYSIIMTANDHAVLTSSCIWNSRTALSWLQMTIRVGEVLHIEFTTAFSRLQMTDCVGETLHVELMPHIIMANDHAVLASSCI